MLRIGILKVFVVSPLILCFAACESLPGNRRSQGAVIGGAAGAAAGAAVSKNNRAMGAIVGGILGAGGGYVIASRQDKTHGGGNPEAATQAARRSQERPATANEAQSASTGDLNADGFVTLDEVVAMKQAGFSDERMLEKLRATDQVFELTADQEKYLMDRGVSRHVVSQMARINQSGQHQRTDVMSGNPR